MGRPVGRGKKSAKPRGQTFKLNGMNARENVPPHCGSGTAGIYGREGGKAGESVGTGRAEQRQVVIHRRVRKRAQLSCRRNTATSSFPSPAKI